MQELIRIAIADDEPGMRLVMRKLIKSNPDYELVGEFENGQALLDSMDDINPEVVILDVEMPGLTGVECARIIQDTNPMTVLVFATAHQEYMEDAFAVYAFDYLLKPFKVERVYHTLERISERLRGQREESRAGAVLPPQREAKGRIMLRHKDGVSFLNMSEILLVQRENRSTVIYTHNPNASPAEGRYVTSDSLTELMARLDPNIFFRCHKSYIVNLDHIDSITPYGRWTYIIRLRPISQDALITHDKFEELEAMFK